MEEEEAKAFITRHAPKRARKFPQSRAKACSAWSGVSRERLGTENVDTPGRAISYRDLCPVDTKIVGGGVEPYGANRSLPEPCDPEHEASPVEFG